jgi:hypothetical protein
MDDRIRSPWAFSMTARWLPSIAVFCAAAWLGGCAAIEEAFFPPEAEPGVVVEPEPLPAVEPVLPPAPKPRPAPRVARLPTPVERPPQPQPAPQPEAQPGPASEVPPLPEIKLVGMSRGEAATLLGAPTEERDVAPAKIWKFATGECVVDVYFYLDVARNDFYALHYNVQDRNGATTGEAAERCLQRIYSENRK